MADRKDVGAAAPGGPADAPPARFRRHRYLSYQGYSFPWYAVVLWLAFFIGGILYFVRNVLLR